MREQVCIVLNERETQKSHAAQTLSTLLSLQSISNSRIPITPNLEKTLRERAPRVIVLDYLLGDYTTGIDILSACRRHSEFDSTEFLFFTDEPSVQVAVNAIKLGARNYYPLESTSAVSSLAEEIRQILLEALSSQLPKNEPLQLKQLIAQSRLSRELLEQAEIEVQKRSPIVVIHGPAGSGTTSLAQALAQQYFQQDSANTRKYLRTIDLNVCYQSIEAISGIPCTSTKGSPVAHSSGLNASVRLGTNLCLILEHVDVAEPDWLELLSSKYEQLWPHHKSQHNILPLIATTHDAQTAKRWGEIVHAPLLSCPSLQQRRDDIAPLAQYFLMQAEMVLKKRVKSLDVESLQWLSSQEWPGNLRQLNAVVTDAAVRMSTKNASSMLSALEQHKLLWESETQAFASLPLDQWSTEARLKVSQALHQCNGNLRAAAAFAGIDIGQLRTLLGSGL